MLLRTLAGVCRLGGEAGRLAGRQAVSQSVRRPGRSLFDLNPERCPASGTTHFHTTTRTAAAVRTTTTPTTTSTMMTKDAPGRGLHSGCGILNDAPNRSLQSHTLSLTGTRRHSTPNNNILHTSKRPMAISQMVRLLELTFLSRRRRH